MQPGHQEQQEKFAAKLEQFFTSTVPQHNFEKPLDPATIPKKEQQLVSVFANFGEKNLEDPVQQTAWATRVDQLKQSLSAIPITAKGTSGEYALAAKEIISEIFSNDTFIKEVLEKIGQPQSPSPRRPANQGNSSQREVAQLQLDAPAAHKAYQLLKQLTVNFGNDLRKLRVGDQTCDFQIQVEFNFDFLRGVERGSFLWLYNVSLLDHEKTFPFDASDPNPGNLTLLSELSKFFGFNLNGPHHLDRDGNYSLFFNCAVNLTEDDQFQLTSMSIEADIQ